VLLDRAAGSCCTGASTWHGALGSFDIVEGRRATYWVELLKCQPD